MQKDLRRNVHGVKQSLLKVAATESRLLSRDHGFVVERLVRRLSAHNTHQLVLVRVAHRQWSRGPCQEVPRIAQFSQQGVSTID